MLVRLLLLSVVAGLLVAGWLLVGRGLEADPEQALQWATRAAEQDHPPAMHQLGSYYEKGFGTEPEIVLETEHFVEQPSATQRRPLHDDREKNRGDGHRDDDQYDQQCRPSAQRHDRRCDEDKNGGDIHQAIEPKVMLPIVFLQRSSVRVLRVAQPLVVADRPAGPGGGGCFGFAWWQKDADYNASVWDLQGLEAAGTVSTDVSGTSFLPALVVPLPLIARTQSKACKTLADQLHAFIVNETV